MKILVTGGAGFIGSHVVDAYVEAGHDVAVVDDLSSGSKANVNAKAAFYEMDIRSDGLAEVFAAVNPDVVGHFAAQMNVTHSVSNPQFDADVNVVGSINMLENCVKHKVKKVIYASTGGAIYGNPDQLPASEDYPADPLSPYGVSKFCVERYLRLYFKLYGLNYTVLRFPNVYGPRQNPHGEAGVCAIFIDLMRAGKTPVLYGEGTPLRDYVYVGDIARGNVLALDRADGEIINLGSGKGTSVLEIYRGLKELMKFEGDAELKPLRNGEVQEVYTTGDKAAAVLGWRPEVSVEEGLARTVAHELGKDA